MKQKTVRKLLTATTLTLTCVMVINYSVKAVKVLKAGSILYKTLT